MVWNMKPTKKHSIFFISSVEHFRIYFLVIFTTIIRNTAEEKTMKLKTISSILCRNMTPYWFHIYWCILIYSWHDSLSLFIFFEIPVQIFNIFHYLKLCNRTPYGVIFDFWQLNLIRSEILPWCLNSIKAHLHNQKIEKSCNMTPGGVIFHFW